MAIHFSAKVKRIFVNADGVHILLEGKGDGYFFLSNEHPEYKALYALALVAATNSYNLHIRTNAERKDVTDKAANVRYMLIDW